jgi:hypothetical protein
MRSPIHPAAFAAALTLAGCSGTRSTPDVAPAAVTPSTSPWDTTGLLRVRFARGTTSGLVNDSLRAGETRGYLIGAEQGPTAYTLAIQIPRRLTPTAGDPTAAIAGTAPSRAPVDYIIEGDSGQTLAASLRESDPATLHLYGLDDSEQLAPLPERRRLWAGRLPRAQDYVVSVVPADEGAHYELTVTLR